MFAYILYNFEAKYIIHNIQLFGNYLPSSYKDLYLSKVYKSAFRYIYYVEQRGDAAFLRRFEHPLLHDIDVQLYYGMDLYMLFQMRLRVFSRLNIYTMFCVIST